MNGEKQIVWNLEILVFRHSETKLNIVFKKWLVNEMFKRLSHCQANKPLNFDFFEIGDSYLPEFPFIKYSTHMKFLSTAESGIV